MDINEIFKISGAIITSVGGAGIIILGFSSWFGKLWAERILQNEASKLRKEVFEHEIRFSSLHKKQAKVIAILYGKMVDYKYAAQDFISYQENTEIMEKNYFEKQTELFLFWERNKIYLPESLSNDLYRFIKEIRSNAITQSVWGNIKALDTRESRHEALEKIQKSVEDFEKKLPSMLEKLELQFRFLLGVKNYESLSSTSKPPEIC